MNLDWVYSLLQTSETNQMLILFVLLIMFFAIFYDLFSSILRFNKWTTIVICIIIDALALLSGIAIYTVHAVISLGAMFGAAGILIAVIVAFVAFALLHLGFGRLAIALKRRR